MGTARHPELGLGASFRLLGEVPRCLPRRDSRDLHHTVPGSRNWARERRSASSDLSRIAVPGAPRSWAEFRICAPRATFTTRCQASGIGPGTFVSSASPALSRIAALGATRSWTEFRACAARATFSTRCQASGIGPGSVVSSASPDLSRVAVLGAPRSRAQFRVCAPRATFATHCQASGIGPGSVVFPPRRRCPASPS
jgi:hypothetical protein